MDRLWQLVTAFDLFLFYFLCPVGSLKWPTLLSGLLFSVTAHFQSATIYFFKTLRFIISNNYRLWFRMSDSTWHWKDIVYVTIFVLFAKITSYFWKSAHFSKHYCSPCLSIYHLHLSPCDREVKKSQKCWRYYLDEYEIHYYFYTLDQSFISCRLQTPTKMQFVFIYCIIRPQSWTLYFHSGIKIKNLTCNSY